MNVGKVLAVYHLDYSATGRQVYRVHKAGHSYSLLTNVDDRWITNSHEECETIDQMPLSTLAAISGLLRSHGLTLEDVTNTKGPCKHTKAPWKVQKELNSRGGEWLITVDRGSHRGIAIAETRVATGQECANAHLIAAAPEMLEMLENILLTGEARCLQREIVSDIEKIIAKAKGEQNEIRHRIRPT